MRELGVLIGVGALVAVCLFALWRITARLGRTQKELQSTVGHNQAACLERIGQVGQSVESLELSGQSTGDAIARVMNRSLRSQATHLLRSGMMPDTVALTLGVAKREARLIADVTNVLTR